MRRKLGFFGVLFSLFVGMLGFAPEASAQTILFENWYGCESSDPFAGKYHYRLIERAVQDPNGHQHKNWFLTIFQGNSYVLYQANSFYGDSPYHVYVSIVSGGGVNNCRFSLGTHGGFGFDWTWLNFHSDNGNQASGNWRADNAGGSIYYGNWTDQSITNGVNTFVYNCNCSNQANMIIEGP